jgi:hypothetical protein
VNQAPCIRPGVDFRRNGGVDGGERVVPFQIGGRRLTQAERNDLMFSTPPIQHWKSVIGELVQERKDHTGDDEVGALGQPARSCTSREARNWAERVGFTGVEVLAAAEAAKVLRREHGAGNVSRAMVVDRMACAASDPHEDTDLLAAWEPVQCELAQAVGESTYRTWLAPLHPHAFIDGEWTVGCTPKGVGWVNDRFRRLLESAADCPVTVVACDWRPA